MRALLLHAAAIGIARASDAGPYVPTWESVTKHGGTPWFSDAKFGIYAHWGPYSVPAFGSEWYSRNMYVCGSRENAHHLATYGPLDTHGYKDLIPLFTAPAFNASAWASLYRRAGAQYAGPVAEHADGFSMFASRASHYNAVEMGPRRDVVGELSAALRAEGLRVITTLHHQWLYAWYPTYNASLPHDAGNATFQLTPQHGGLYGPHVTGPMEFTHPNSSIAFQDYFLAKTLEVISYKPDVMYFDSKWKAVINDEHRLSFLAQYYNAAVEWGKDVVVTYKDADLEVGAGLLDIERGGTGGILTPTWQTDDALDRGSWSWVNPPSLKNASELVGELVDIVSKGGNLLLDVPPHADGSFDPAVVSTLLSIGQWLGINGGAIFSTRPWHTFGEGPTAIVPGGFHEFPLFTPRDFRITAAPDGTALFLFLMVHGTSGTTYDVRCLNASALPTLTEVTLIGVDAAVDIHWTQDASGLHIDAIDSGVVPLADALLPLALRLHLNGATAEEIDAPSAAVRARIQRPEGVQPVLPAVPVASQKQTTVTLSNVLPRRDTSGAIMDAHDGNIIHWQGTYLWYAAGYGPCLERNSTTGCAGGFVGCGFLNNHSVNLWSSTDLATWTPHGNVLPEANRVDAILFSPKVVYNARTQLFVLWYNYVPRYSYGVATSPTPYGPFITVNSSAGSSFQYGFPSNSDIGDFSILLDDDGDAYFLYSAHAHCQVERLAPDFLSSTWIETKETSGVLPHGNEAPALFKRDSVYWALVSDSCCYCEEGGLVRAFSATSPLGPYVYMGEIAAGPHPGGVPDGRAATEAQQTAVIAVPDGAGNTTYVWVGDRWQSAPDRLKAHDFTFWAPIPFFPNGSIGRLTWMDAFNLAVAQDS